MKKTLLFALLLLFAGISAQIGKPKPEAKQLLTEKEKGEIFVKLFAKSHFDKQTGVSYIFENPPKNDEKTLAVAQEKGFFFAKPNLLNLYITDEEGLKTLEKEHIAYKKVAKDVYQVTVSGDMQTAKQNFEKKKGIKYVVYEYYAQLQNCVTWNDPEAVNAWGGGAGQLWLSNADWIAGGINDVPTQSIDSVDLWRPMHTQTSVANPNIVATVIDSGIDVNNPDFSGNVLYAYNFFDNTSGNDITNSNHGSNTTGIFVAKANNAYGGVGVAHDFPIISLDVGVDMGLFASALYSAMDYIDNSAIANPNQKYVINMSFSSGNDLVFYQKLLNCYNLQNHKQVFFIAAAGNFGNTAPVAYPASWSEVFAVGATNSGDPNRGLWSGSCTGPELDFVADGGNCWTMNANGTFSTTSGTSDASPIVAGAVANLVAQDPNADFATIYNRLKMGAKDLGTAGFDNYYGWGYIRTATSLKYAVVEDVPTTIDCAGNANYLYNFTPKFYNGSYTLNRVCYYPNGTQVPYVTNADGTVTFKVVVNTNNGFSTTNPKINRLRYEFIPANYAGCLTSIKTQPITITNLSTLATSEVSQNDFKIYPNPVKDVLTIETKEKISKIEIYSTTGQLVKIAKENKVDVSALAKGIYVLKISTEKGVRTEKFVKE